MTRKRYTVSERRKAFDDAHGLCWRCGEAIDAVHGEEWHMGHVDKPECFGGKEVAPEHARCNMQDAYESVIPLDAKWNRIRAKFLGIKKDKPKFGWSRE